MYNVFYMNPLQSLNLTNILLKSVISSCWVVLDSHIICYLTCLVESNILADASAVFFLPFILALLTYMPLEIHL